MLIPTMYYYFLEIQPSTSLNPFLHKYSKLLPLLSAKYVINSLIYCDKYVQFLSKNVLHHKTSAKFSTFSFCSSRKITVFCRYFLNQVHNIICIESVRPLWLNATLSRSSSKWILLLSFPKCCIHLLHFDRAPRPIFLNYIHCYLTSIYPVNPLYDLPHLSRVLLVELVLFCQITSLR